MFNIISFTSSGKTVILKLIESSILELFKSGGYGMNVNKINLMYQAEYDKEKTTFEDIQGMQEVKYALKGEAGENLKKLNDPNAELNFQKLLDGKSAVCFFVGFKNTGKSTYLKCMFNFCANTAQLQREKKRIILPVLNAGTEENIAPYEKVINNIKGICDKLSEEYPETKELYLETGVEKFYQYIIETKGSLLPELDFEEECSMPEVRRKSTRIGKLQKKYSLSYQLLRLKFYLSNYCSDIEKVVIIIDNIHKLRYDNEKIQEFIRYYLDVFECLENENSRDSQRHIQTYLIIAARPVTYRQLKNDDKINSYISSSVLIWKNNKIDTVQLFEKIGMGLKTQISVDSEVAPQHDISYRESLYHLGIKFKYKYSSMIEQLCFSDYDLMTEAYYRILSNITWVKKGSFRYSSNGVAQKGVSYTNITCIRALACGNNKLYRNNVMTENARSIDCLIPNLLYNTESQNYGVFILYTMKFFLRRFSEKMEYGDDYIVLKDYMRCFTSVFPTIPEKVFIETIVYLFKAEVLRKSVVDIEGPSGEVYDCMYDVEIGTENKMYITSRGRRLFDMLKEDSVLLEICREDMYREIPILDDNMKSSYDLMMEGKQNILFLDLLDIIKKIFDEEREYFELVYKNKKKDIFVENFGKRPLALTLLEGVSKSIQYSGCCNVIGSLEKTKKYITDKWSEFMVY